MRLRFAWMMVVLAVLVFGAGFAYADTSWSVQIGGAGAHQGRHGWSVGFRPSYPYYGAGYSRPYWGPTYGYPYGYYAYSAPVYVYSVPPVYPVYTYPSYPSTNSYQGDYSSRIRVSPPPPEAPPANPAPAKVQNPPVQPPAPTPTAPVQAQAPEPPKAEPVPAKAPIEATKEALERERSALLRGDAFLKKGQIRQAKEAYEEALFANPGSGTACFALAHAETALGFFSSASAHVLEGLRKDPDWPNRGLKLREVFPDGPSLDQRLADVREASKLDSLPASERGQMQFLLGYLLWCTGDRKAPRPRSSRFPRKPPTA